jgi:AraC-like DNA-binding protein
VFSERGITIEHYFIAQKIEKAKELLVYDELSLSEIAIQLNYSNVAYLSSQFKSDRFHHTFQWRKYQKVQNCEFINLINGL